MHKKILIYWEGLPNYATFFIEKLKQRNHVTILNKNNFNCKKILNKNFDIFIFSGWNNPIILIIALILKIKNTKLICMVDNIKKNNIKQFCGKIFFFFFKFGINIFFVPGIESKKLLNYFGVHNEFIFEGLYSYVNPSFKIIKKIEKRDNAFIFVGQIINRKNIKYLILNFIKFREKNPDWKLFIVGKNIMNINFTSFKKYGIKYLNFKHNNSLTKLYNNAKCLILPSRIDHWGVVCLEAIKCGCLLILSNKVGCKSDLISANGLIFDVEKENDLYKKMIQFSQIKTPNLKTMSKNSYNISQRVNGESMINYLKNV